MQWLAGLSLSKVAMWAVLVGVAIEAVTLALRFGAGMQSTRDTGFLAYLFFDIRIHHGYVGLALLLIAALRPEPVGWRHLALIIGGALVLSDLVHHFCVLWPVTGSPQFHLVYPSWRGRGG